jgi:hypothetical protein
VTPDTTLYLSDEAQGREFLSKIARISGSVMLRRMLGRLNNSEVGDEKFKHMNANLPAAEWSLPIGVVVGILLTEVGWVSGAAVSQSQCNCSSRESRIRINSIAMEELCT